MRYTPLAPGQYNVVDIRLNGAVVHEDKLEKKDWNVSGTPKPGFVRVDHGNHGQFELDNGEKYYPVGHNVAWLSDPKSNYNEIFGKMHAAGENWTRVWLDQRDGKHLEAAEVSGKTKLGEIDLELAQKWDTIVSAAEKSDIYFQLVLENSDSYSSATGFADSSNVHPTWDKNPLNSANGGVLKSPDSFFVDATARTLEKRKLYYMLSRWGYSPNIMGLELFHDAQNTDAAFGKHWQDIALWHHEMALFIKNVDGNHHLLTTSSAPGIPLENDIWETVDYVQKRSYAPYILAALTAQPAATSSKKLDKPVFVSEFGSSSSLEPAATANLLHTGLWAGLLSASSGAPGFWDWDAVEKQSLYDVIKPVTAFVTASSLAEHPGLPLTTLDITSSQKGSLSFGPGAEAGATAGPTDFIVGTSGTPAGIERLSPVFAGKADSGKPITFQVNYAQAGSFSVVLSRVSKAGANVKLSVDGGVKPSEKSFPPTASEHAVAVASQVLKLDVPAGAHTVTLQNDGADWVGLQKFTLSNYGTALAGVARANKDYGIAWIYNRDGLDEEDAKSITPATGQIKFIGLQKGKYRATWWDTQSGKTIDSADVDVTGPKESVALNTPPITKDVAMYIMKAGTDKAKVAKSKGRTRTDTNITGGTDNGIRQGNQIGRQTNPGAVNGSVNPANINRPQ